MCDFRQINKIRFLGSGEELDVSNSVIDITCDRYKNFNGSPGFYHVGCSGCGYQYYDGESWLREKNDYYPDEKWDYEVTDYIDTDGKRVRILGDWDE